MLTMTIGTRFGGIAWVSVLMLPAAGQASLLHGAPAPSERSALDPIARGGGGGWSNSTLGPLAALE